MTQTITLADHHDFYYITKKTPGIATWYKLSIKFKGLIYKLKFKASSLPQSSGVT